MIPQRLAALRREMKKHNIAVYTKRNLRKTSFIVLTAGLKIIETGKQRTTR